MSVTELIAKELSVLPMPLQQEVLDFVAFLKAKSQTAMEESGWNSMSLQGALAGMEEDVFPEYRENDLIERW
jgi:Protein of unknown function (DUF2281)